jgi:hypothetical protein
MSYRIVLDALLERQRLHGFDGLRLYFLGRPRDASPRVALSVAVGPADVGADNEFAVTLRNAVPGAALVISQYSVPVPVF